MTDRGHLILYRTLIYDFIYNKGLELSVEEIANLSREDITAQELKDTFTDLMER